jgi:hypothetical protein
MRTAGACLDRREVVSEPKTAKGRRSLALDPATIAALREHRTRQLEQRLAVGPRWQDSGLVFTWPEGRPIHPERFSRWFEQHARDAGLPKIRLHDVRHSYATAALADTPPLMADGNWRVGVFMDAAASQEQAEKLGAVFAGQLGGPMAMLAPLITEMLGVQTAPIEFVEDGRRHRVRIGDEVDITVEDFVPPQTPEGPVEQLVGMFHPANSTLTIARATASRVNAFGLQFDNTGKNGHSAPFSWAA